MRGMEQPDFNIFNFPQHFGMLKHRLKVVKEKKSVSEFQYEYLEFKLQYLEFSIKIQLNYTWNPLKNNEKARLSRGRSRFAITKIQHFPAESKLC